MSQPGMIGNIVPPDLGWVAREFADIKRKVLELSGVNWLAGAVIGIGNYIKSSNFDGTLDPPTAGTMGFALGGNAGNAVFNNITLRGSIIGNDALTNPLEVANAQGVGSGLAATSSFVTWATATVTVPAGFTKAVVQAQAIVALINTGGASSFQINTIVNGVSAAVFPLVTLPAGETATLNNPMTTILTGLTGGATVSASVQVVSGAGVPANVNNGAVAEILCVFLR